MILAVAFQTNVFVLCTVAHTHCPKRDFYFQFRYTALASIGMVYVSMYYCEHRASHCRLQFDIYRVYVYAEHFRFFDL